MNFFKNMKNRTKLIIVIIAVVLIIIAIIGNNLCFPKQHPNQICQQMQIAENYLRDLNYEQAVVEFLRAIEIDPMSETAYLGAAEAYVAMEMYEEAIAILAEGLVVTGKTEIQERLTEYQEVINAIREAQEEVERETAEREAAEREVLAGLQNSNNDSQDVQILVPLEGFPKIERHEGGDGGYGYFEYDEYGRLIKVTYHSTDGSYSISEHSVCGTQQKVYIYYSDGSFNQYQFWEYNENGIVKKGTIQFASGITWIQEYDAYGNLTITEYDADGNYIGEIIH